MHTNVHKASKVIDKGIFQKLEHFLFVLLSHHISSVQQKKKRFTKKVATLEDKLLIFLSQTEVS